MIVSIVIESILIVVLFCLYIGAIRDGKKAKTKLNTYVDATIQMPAKLVKCVRVYRDNISRNDYYDIENSSLKDTTLTINQLGKSIVITGVKNIRESQQWLQYKDGMPIYFD